MKKILIVFTFLILASCSQDDDVISATNVLSDYIAQQSTEVGAVIACAASEENTTTILTFFYPEAGATNIRFYATQSSIENALDYTKYTFQDIESVPVFNGYLRRFKTESANEHLVIVTYILEGEVKLSNPVRIKHLTKQTVWNTAVAINQNTALMPEFSWQNNAFGDNAIYFQVVSNTNNDLISGTYTYQNTFQFYNLSNVVLNITEGLPELEVNTNYNFTLMDVSIDNWVNLVSQNSFTTP